MPSTPPPSELVGVWKLLSFNLHRKPAATNGTGPGDAADNGSYALGPAVHQPLGRHPTGRLTILPQGFMSAILTASGLAPIATGEWSRASAEDIERVARPMISYFGACRFYEEDGTSLMATNVEVALNPNWVGKEQVRKWRMVRDGEGAKGVLELRPVQELELPDGSWGVGVLRWEKVLD